MKNVIFKFVLNFCDKFNFKKKILIFLCSS